MATPAQLTAPRFTVGGDQGQAALATPAGRRPQICPTWMTREEFEVCRSDPYRAFDAAQTRIQELQQRVAVGKKMNQTLLQDPQYQFGKAVQSFEQLRKDHIQLNDQYNDLEAVNETLQEVLEVLRGDKHQLLIEINAAKREVMIQGIENEQLENKARQVAAFNESLDLKLKAQENQVSHLDDESRTLLGQLTDLQGESAALEATCQSVSLQSSSLSDLRQHLETTRVAQDRAIQALEREVQGKVQEVVQHDAQLWEFKREMSGRVLALQKKAQECNDELGRLQRLGQHEMATLASQNQALNDELKITADTLFQTRKEKTDFSQAAKRELSTLREEIQQCTSVIDLVERQNQGLEASIARMMDQNKLSEKQIAEKDTINHKNLIEQANFLAMLHMELQTTREDLYILKARLCHHCRGEILGDEAEEDKKLIEQSRAAAAAAGLPDTTAGGETRGLAPMEFDQDGAPVVAKDNSIVEDELKRTREALQAVSKQLLEERAQRHQEEELRKQEEEERAARQIEEDARRRRAADDKRKADAGEEAKTFTVRFVDGTRKKVDAFLSNSIGELVERIAAKVGIRQHELLYLAHSVNENSVLGAVDRFLDKNKSLEQEAVTPKSNLVFKFKHHKRHQRWTDTVAQEWYFRQIHASVVGEYYPVHERLAVELASWELQAVFGDATGKKRHAYFDRVGLDSYLPVSVSAHDYEYWQERLYQLHKQRKGASAIEARNKFLDTFAGKSPYWGMTFFDIRDRNNRPFLAGIAEDGLHIFNASKGERTESFRFDQIVRWERSENGAGLFVGKRSTNKNTFFACSELQSKEMCDLLSEYYMLLPAAIRDVLGAVVPGAETLRARLPPPEIFDTVVVRRRPVEFYSRLENLKVAYMEHCLSPDADGSRHEPIAKFTAAIDKALDNDENLDTLDLSYCDPPVTNLQLAAVHDLFRFAMDHATPTDNEQWRENIDLRTVSFAHTADEQLLTEHAIPNICSILRRFTQLTAVDLTNVRLENKNEGDVSDALCQLPKMERLVLRGCGVGVRGFDFIVRIFGINPSLLTTVDLGDNRLTQACITKLVPVLEGDNCSLTDLDLSTNAIDSSGLEALTTAARRRRRLKRFAFSDNPGGRGAGAKFAELIAAATGITDLDISSSGITGDDAGIRIATELRSREEITKLHLSGNPIGPTLTRQRQPGSGEIARDYPADFFAFLNVGTHARVEELYMDRCELHDDAGQGLATVLHNNTFLRTLVLSNNQLAPRQPGVLPDAWFEMLRINSTLRVLHMSYNGMSHRGVMQLLSVMAHNNGVQELKLDGNAMERYSTQEQHQGLVECLERNTTLTTLSLCNVYMKDDVLQRIAEGLRRNRTLKRLEANNNELTVRGITDASPALAENTTLEYLDLSCRSVHTNDEQYMQAYKHLIDNSNVEMVLL